MANVNKKFVIIKFIVPVAAVLCVFIVGAVIRHIYLSNQIKELAAYFETLNSQADEMEQQINISDAQSKTDKAFLDIMFDDIFTFYSEDDFDGAKQMAESYNLPKNFVESFYDKSELNSGYAEMLDIMLKYDSCDLYLIERSNSVGYYIAVVNLDLVKYSDKIQMAFFIALGENGDISERVYSMACYNIN